MISGKAIAFTWRDFCVYAIILLMKGNRLLALVVNILAAVAVVASAFLEWFNGALPTATEAHDIASFVPISVQYSNATVATSFTVAAVLFVAAGFFVLAGIFSQKLLTMAGVFLAGLVVVTWFVASGVHLDIFVDANNVATNADVDSFGAGVFSAIAAAVLGLLSLFIPRSGQGAAKSAS